MKIYILSILFISTTSFVAGAQSLGIKSGHLPVKILYIVKFHDKPPVVTFNYFVDRKVEERLKIFPIAECDKLNYELGTYAVAVVHLKSNVQTVTLRDLFRKYHIPEKYQRLKVKFDIFTLDFPGTLLTSYDQIQKVRIVKAHSSSYIQIETVRNGVSREIEKAERNGEIFVN